MAGLNVKGPWHRMCSAALQHLGDRLVLLNGVHISLCFLNSGIDEERY